MSGVLILLGFVLPLLLSQERKGLGGALLESLGGASPDIRPMLLVPAGPWYTLLKALPADPWNWRSKRGRTSSPSLLAPISNRFSISTQN